MKPVESLESENLQKFLSEVEKVKAKAVILSVISPFAERRAPKLFNNLPMSLDELYDNQKYQDSFLKELREFNVPKISEEEKIAFQEATVKQSEIDLWFKFRAGRITAS